MSAALVGTGLRRIPRTRGARAVLGTALGILVTMRLLALWPTGAHTITARLFPLSESTARAEFEERACGELCDDGRTRVVSFESKMLYDVYYDQLQGEAQIKATVEVAKPFFQDVCGYVYDQRPTVPESVRVHTTLQSCEAAHPQQRPVFDTVPSFEPSPCCRLEVKERRPGQRIETRRDLLFVFHALKWQSSH
jgi:hypothetical protein